MISMTDLSEFENKDKMEEMEPRETDILDCYYEPDIPEKQGEKELDDFEVPQPRRHDFDKCVSCCKKFIRFLFSTIGVICVLVAYCIAGGFLFVWLEAENEKLTKYEAKNVADEFRRNYTQRLWEVTSRLNVLHPKNWTEEAEIIMKEFQQGVYKQVAKGGWDGRLPSEESDFMWSFAGSLLYAVTVITTIGYGHITPITIPGRLVTIFYALFGIPITLLYLANVGSFMANTFRFCYHRLCCDLCCCCFKLNSRSKRESRCKTPNGSPAKTASRSISLPVIRGDLSPTRGVVLNSAMKKSGSVGTQLCTSAMKSSKSDPDGKFSRPPSSVSFSTNNNTHEQRSHRLNIRHSVTSAKGKYIDWKGKYRYKPIPISLTIVVMAGYIFGGAVLFSVWEKWGYIEGSYFCFITLTTIGLGDLVPGIHKESDWFQSEKLVLCSLYVFLGLALIAMSMDLMQEEVRSKFQWLAEKIGITDKKTNDLDFDEPEDEIISVKDYV